MATVPISELELLEEGAVSQADELVIVDISASATKKVTTVALVSDAMKQLPPGSIPGNIFSPTDGENSIGENELKDGSVTEFKLADGSSGKYLTSLDGTGSEGSYVGQLGNFNAASYMWSGVRWTPMGEAIALGGVANDFLTTAITSFGGQTEVEARFTINRNYAGRYLSYDANGNIVATVVAADDLQKGSDIEYGVVRIPDGKGLKVLNGDISIDNEIEPKNMGGLFSISYDQNGLVTGSRAYAEGDLPYASTTVAGVMKVGTGLRTSGNGTVSVQTSELELETPVATEITPGIVMPLADKGLEVDSVGGLSVVPYYLDPNFSTATKVTFDSNGLVLTGSFLEASDLPPLDFEQIQTGVLGGDRINDGTLPRRALADFCVSFIQEGEPPLNTAFSIGTYWYKESTKVLRIYTGTRWSQVGASSGGNSTATLEWAGFIDATTGLVTQVTSFGQNNGGFVIGQGLPPATDELTGYYCIVTVPGAGIPETPDSTYTENDWVICLGAEEGWSYFNQDAGAGGGASNLSDLLDTEIDLVGEGHVLTFDGDAGKWTNSLFISGAQYGTKIQHKYSTDLDLDPEIGSIELGEFYLNINDASPTLYLRCSNPITGEESLKTWTSDEALLRVQAVLFTEPMYNATDIDLDPGAIPTVAIREASDTEAGSMSAADKIKLDAIDLSAVDGVQVLTGAAPILVTDTDPINNPGNNFEVSCNVVTNTTNGLMLATDKIVLDTLRDRVQTQSDFNVSDTQSAAYIKNKPLTVTQASEGYMSAADKIKLDNIQDNANDGIIEAPVDGQSYVRRNEAWSVLAQAQPGAQVVVNSFPPGGAAQGDLWLDSNTGELHVYYNDGDSSQWINTSTAGGGLYTEGIARPPQIGGNPPVNARAGDFWLDSRSGTLYIYYPDGDSEQWIACSSGNTGGGTSVNGNTPIGAAPPINPIYGDTWIDPDTLALYVYFNDGGSDQWAQVTTVSAAGGPAFTQDPPSDPKTGALWIRPSTLKQYVYTGSAWASVVCC